MLEIHGSETIARLREATEADHGLVTYDHTKLSAINVCPVWGILRYSLHKRMPMVGRAMALEAGQALHEVFAFVRLVSLCDQCDQRGCSREFIDKVWAYHGTRLFGYERLQHIQGVVSEAADMVDMAKRGAIGVLDTGGFYDDPRDKRRTLSNMEEAAYAYINRWRWDHPVWMRDLSDPTSDVGIEIPFDVVVDITGKHELKFRFTGRIDGIHYDASKRLTIHDNKTASRLGDAWTQAQEISHQFTGYIVAARIFCQDIVERCDVLGLALPLPRTYDYGGYARENMVRAPHHVQRWLDWMVHTILLEREYKDDPIKAPKYTHSCNRFFRPCSFIPLCYSSDDDARKIIEDEMETNVWDPLNKEVLEGVGNE